MTNSLSVGLKYHKEFFNVVIVAIGRDYVWVELGL
jgi:hypothetical protein